MYIAIYGHYAGIFWVPMMMFSQVCNLIFMLLFLSCVIFYYRNKKRFHAQALVEVKILEHLRKRDVENTIIRMFTSFYFRNHLCIVFELMSLNLYELIRRNHYQGFSFSLIKKFTICLLKCLVLLKQENIIHCDLKPVSWILYHNFPFKHVLFSSIGLIHFKSVNFSWVRT